LCGGAVQTTVPSILSVIEAGQNGGWQGLQLHHTKK
jgi:hypothetical protein